MLPFFEWCEASALGQFIRTSTWLFPVIESVHLLGLCLLGGAVLLLDIRMLGGGLRTATISQLHTGTGRWLRRALILLVATGVPLFVSEAVKCYYNPSFWVKMTALPMALGFAAFVRAPAARGATEATARTRLVAVASIALWFIVAAAGRWIGLSS